MGTISKPNTFTGETAPQLPWLDACLDPLYNEINGNLEDANVKSNANIAQSKIANLVANLAAKLAKAGDTMTGSLIMNIASIGGGILIKAPAPGLVLRNTLDNEGDWRIQAAPGANGALEFYENTGTIDAPNYIKRFQLAYDGNPAAASDLISKAYLDSRLALAFSKVVKSNGNVSTASSSFEDVAGLSTVVATGARRCRVSFIGHFVASTSNTRIMSVNLQVDGVNQGGTDGLAAGTSTDTDRPANLSFSFVTDILTAASHTFKIQIKSATGTSILLADATRHAVLMVEEIPNA